MPKEPAAKYWAPDDVARELGVSRQRVRQLVSIGQLSPEMRVGRQRLMVFDRDVVYRLKRARGPQEWRVSRPGQAPRQTPATLQRAAERARSGERLEAIVGRPVMAKARLEAAADAKNERLSIDKSAVQRSRKKRGIA